MNWLRNSCWKKNGTLDWDALTKSQKGSARCVEYLTTWLESKELRKTKKRRRKIPFEGKLEQSFERFCAATELRLRLWLV